MDTNLIAHRLNKIIPFAEAFAFVVEGEDYIVTTGTGEGAFAYEAAEVERWLDGEATGLGRGARPYDNFCQEVDAVLDRGVAVAIYRAAGVVVCREGSCERILDDEDTEALDGLAELLGDKRNAAPAAFRKAIRAADRVIARVIARAAA